MTRTVNELAIALHKIGAVKFGNFTLKSGRTSNIYLDIRRIISYPNLLSDIALLLWDKIKDCQFDLICGVPYTALPIATVMSIQQNIPMIMRRKEKKSYGMKQSIEGVYQSNQTCLVIEDIITTGSSIQTTIDDLHTEKLKVKDVVVLVNREEGGDTALKQNNLNLHAIFTLNELLTALKDCEQLTPNEYKILESL